VKAKRLFPSLRDTLKARKAECLRLFHFESIKLDNFPDRIIYRIREDMICEYIKDLIISHGSVEGKRYRIEPLPLNLQGHVSNETYPDGNAKIPLDLFGVLGDGMRVMKYAANAHANQNVHMWLKLLTASNIRINQFVNHRLLLLMQSAESHDIMNEVLPTIFKCLFKLEQSGIIANGQYRKIEFHFIGDDKWICILLGLQGACSTYYCFKCLTEGLINFHKCGHCRNIQDLIGNGVNGSKYPAITIQFDISRFQECMCHANIATGRSSVFSIVNRALLKDVGNNALQEFIEIFAECHRFEEVSGNISIEDVADSLIFDHLKKLNITAPPEGWIRPKAIEARNEYIQRKMEEFDTLTAKQNIPANISAADLAAMNNVPTITKVQEIFRKYKVAVDLNKYLNSSRQKVMLTGDQFRNIAAAIDELAVVLSLSVFEVTAVKDMDQLLRICSTNEPSPDQQLWVVRNASNVVLNYVVHFTKNRAYNYAHKLACHIGDTMKNHRSVGLFSASSCESNGGMMKLMYNNTNGHNKGEDNVLRQVIDQVNMRYTVESLYSNEFLEKREKRKRKRKGILEPCDTDIDTDFMIDESDPNSQLPDFF
jgi:hypothetical protein